ncbi:MULTISPECIES: 3-(3-hydroxy-phenyl)propionate transporter MhpT [unclassified Paraburkholderia]|uniref:3-(3-hydroxy-phenyl)propionate transporter MhpT n=1 Tax=unclassified Paraburkholderia TaxID=2615204 RepID=UPI0016229D72|nr:MULTISPECIES: 3-(3-hydroxy-phenyl)propionate transporter MhpT [unclassified Paraburkholderia]MBB5410225.1 AAHS family 3-hydroxyphenylpropionic acid transporter [Paraburkholderia sp. HC6.4b]MBB5452434.1 AAHS family 3-hydroxyphenylpropionic acid transporter [Paraburkholderia sp. Kb1A]MBC8722427.1 3-(3-hydroxy-phenyl)propionate transporter MhpT [Paraburkholderia sp. 31.1]MBC8729744.1 3-(3-hydroxy-phenyl)propionate transporter MhpT [Paraburkholderia sp. UCT2]
MSSVANRSSAVGSSTALTLALCFLVAVLEGIDLQSTGVAAPRMAHEFGLSVSQLGLAFSAGMLGLLPGAMIGGRLADRIGRKRVLMISMAIFGIFSIATAQVWSFESLLIARVLTGIGLGGAMPNLIALSSEAVDARHRNTAVSVMYCGMPLGGALAALIAVLSAGATAWRHIFYVGGVGPLIIIPLLMALLPESREFATESREFTTADKPLLSTREVLFGEGRAAATIGIWISFFCTLIVLYFLLNWLPSLTVGRGMSRSQAGIAQIFFNVGSVIGVLGIGLLMDRFRQGLSVTAIYACIVGALVALSQVASIETLSVAVLFAGMGVVGAQSMLYSLSAASYPTSVRGTGVGAAVAVGRVGSIVGPVAAGQLLAMGKSSALVIGASVPVTIIAAITALLVIRSNAAKR